MEKEPNPWDRLPRETDKGFAAFRVYLELGPTRSFEAAWRAYREERGLRGERMPSHFRRWKDRNNWPGRAAAFDGHAISAIDDVRIKAQKAALSKLYDASDKLITKAIEIAEQGDDKMLRFLLAQIWDKPKPGGAKLNVAGENVQVNIGQLTDRLEDMPLEELLRLASADE